MRCPTGVERGWRLPPAVLDVKGQLGIRRWDETDSASMGNALFVDCKRPCSLGIASCETRWQQHR